MNSATLSQVHKQCHSHTTLSQTRADQSWVGSKSRVWWYYIVFLFFLFPCAKRQSGLSLFVRSLPATAAQLLKLNIRNSDATDKQRVDVATTTWICLIVVAWVVRLAGFSMRLIFFFGRELTNKRAVAKLLFLFFIFLLFLRLFQFPFNDNWIPWCLTIEMNVVVV